MSITWLLKKFSIKLSKLHMFTEFIFWDLHFFPCLFKSIITRCHWVVVGRLTNFSPTIWKLNRSNFYVALVSTLKDWGGTTGWFHLMVGSMPIVVVLVTGFFLNINVNFIIIVILWGINILNVLSLCLTIRLSFIQTNLLLHHIYFLLYV